MKITLVYPNVGNIPSYNIGLGIIAACLKQKGHEIQGITVYSTDDEDEELEQIETEITRFEPDLIGFSSVSNQYHHVKKIISHLRGRGITTQTLLGGIHATVDPESVLEEGYIDIVCRGEGEEAAVELVEKLERNEDLSDVKNIWFKKDGEITKNDLRPLVEDLGTLPFADSSLFGFQDILEKRDGWLNILVGRGCPYKCSYCVNHYLQKIHQRNSLYRIRPIDHVLEEIAEIEKAHEIKVINFIDDTFTLRKEWVVQFCEAYAKKFKYPFAILARATNFDREIAQALKKAGCIEVKIGIESGVKRIREEILNRKIPNRVIEDVFKIAKDVGLRAWAFNMIGMPTETKEELLETIKLNAKIRPYIMRVSIIFPYKGTAFYESCKKKGILDESEFFRYSSYFDGTVLKLEHLTEADIVRYKTMFKWYVDAHSDIEESGFFKRLVELFEELPDELWLNGEAKKMVKETDEQVDLLLKTIKKEHYCTRNHIDLNYSAATNWELP
jgi:radical SAM superfamily enzyme YgiQ (UPF0313 family)